MSIYKRITNLVIAAAFFASCILIGVAIYKRYQTDIRVEIILSSHFTTLKAGTDVTIIQAVFDEPKGCVMRTGRYLVFLPFQEKEILFDQNEYTTERNPANINPNFVAMHVTIPPFIPPGEYLYYIKGNYYCNMTDYLLGGHSFRSIPIQLTIIP